MGERNENSALGNLRSETDSVKTLHPRQSVILAVADPEALRKLVGFHQHDLGVDASKSHEDRASCLRQRVKDEV